LPFREHRKSLELEFREEEEEPCIVVVVEIYSSATVDFVSCYKKLLKECHSCSSDFGLVSVPDSLSPIDDKIRNPKNNNNMTFKRR